MCFATNFTKLRRLKGYSQEYIAAQILNMEQQNLSLKERGKTRFTQEEKQKLADLLQKEAEAIKSFDDRMMLICKDQKGGGAGILSTINNNMDEQAVDGYKIAISNLEKEIEFLREQNSVLLKMLEEKK